MREDAAGLRNPAAFIFHESGYVLKISPPMHIPPHLEA
jgi:hypothetical protein